MTSDDIDNMKLKCHWERVKRRLDPGSVLFEEGDSYCRCLQKCLPADEKDADLMTGYKEFPCGMSHCHQVFDSLLRYEAHYNSSHRHVCQTCGRVYPTSHLLEVHVLETHDVMFTMLAQKQCMFQCLLADCPLRFKTWKDRKNHMIKLHKYPPNYRYDRAKSGKQTKTAVTPSARNKNAPKRDSENTSVDNSGENSSIENAMEADDNEKNNVANMGENRNIEEGMEADIADNSPAVIGEARPGGKTDQSNKPFVFSYRVPKDISFGQGVPRGFLGSRGRGRGRGRQKKKHWHNTSDSDTKVDIESVSMKDLSDALS